MIQSSSVANRGIVAAMACVLLLMCCKPKTEDSKEGSQTESTKQAAKEEESVPVGTSEPASEQEQLHDGDVVVAPKEQHSSLPDGGKILGVAKWDDKPYTQNPIPGVEGADPHCTKMHKKNPILSEKLIINPNNTVKDVFVYVKSGLPTGQIWPVPSEPVVLDQKGCRYVPHVFGIMVDQELLILNSDETPHNVHALPKLNDEFNRSQSKKGLKLSKTFDTAEMMFKFKCDVHSWMNAYCAVMEHPFYTTTDEKGIFEITGLPDGEYIIATWHERFKKGQERRVTIMGGESKEVEFVFKRPKKKKD